MKKKMELDEPAKLLRNLRKFRRISGSSGKMSESSGLSRLLRKEQAQDHLFQDAAHAPMHEINDDQNEEHEDQSHDEEAQEPIQRQQDVPHPRVHQSIQRDHPVDNILGSIQRGVTTRSRLATFCEFYSFVSSLEPLRV